MGIASSFSRREIRDLFSRARTAIRTPYLEIRKAPSQEMSRVLFVIPRRVGNSVARNKLRRRLKEIFRAHQDAMQGYDFLLLAKSPAAASLSFKELELLVEKALA